MATKTIFISEKAFSDLFYRDEIYIFDELRKFLKNKGLPQDLEIKSLSFDALKNKWKVITEGQEWENQEAEEIYIE
jgi:hypothetical protein